MKTFIRTTLSALLAGSLLISLQGCSSETPEAAEASSSEPTIWTCSMHPQIKQPGPGDCPICGMDLIPLVDDAGNDAGPREMAMSESARALADIQTTEVTRDYPSARIRLVGQLDYDETKVKSLTARFPARIDDLYVNYVGVRVERGEHLAMVYSPDLLAAQRELISSYARDPHSQITAAAREKLRLWDLLPEQIDSIIESGEAKDRFELRAPISGVVVAKNVSEGDYVKTGEALFKIVDLSELWLYLDAYESDLFWLRYGQTVAFSVEAYPGETFEGSIVFIDPELNRKTRTVPVRVNVANADRRLKPGMFARGTVESRIAENGQVYAPDFSGKWICPMHPQVQSDGPGSCDICGMPLVEAESLGYVDATTEAAPLLIPASAVLYTGTRSVAYVKVEGADRPTFVGREIVLGPRAGEVYIVESGLSEGEQVVTNGAFKIDSALQIQAKPSMMSLAGDEETGRVGDMETMGSAVTAGAVEAYFDLQVALAGDDLTGAQEALKAMMTETGHQGAIADVIHTMMAAEDLEALRRPHFETLSKIIISTVQTNPDLLPGEAYLMHCPMAFEDHGADWLQNSDELRNPYFGAMMLGCGELKESIGE